MVHQKENRRVLFLYKLVTIIKIRTAKIIVGVVEDIWIGILIGMPNGNSCFQECNFILILDE
jgi:hypothetical protein